MKKLHIMLLAAMAALVLPASVAAKLSTTINWNLPGAVEVYVGGSGDSYKVTVDAEATSYVATIDNTWGSAYVCPAPGYVFESVKADGKALQPLSSGMYSIDLSTYNGKTVDIVAEAIVYDATFSVDVINGREALTATMWGTNREVSFKTGKQEIAYSSKYEKGVDIQAPADGAVDPSITQDGVEQEWKAYYSWDTYLYHKYQGTSTRGFGFDEGTDFVIKYCDKDDAPEAETVELSVVFADDMARAALEMIFNVTQMKTITERTAFKVNKGDMVRFVFNTRDYSVVANDAPVTPAEGETTPWEVVANEDLTYTFSATERVYPDVEVSLAVADVDGIALRTAEGDAIATADLKADGTMEYAYEGRDKQQHTATLGIYKASVSSKNPKIFVGEAEGYWIEVSEYVSDDEVMPSTIAMPGYTLCVVDHKIVRDTPLVVYVATDGALAKAEDLQLRDRNGEDFTLAEGYNEFLVDPAYSSPFSAKAPGLDEGTAFSVYNDMQSVAVSDETGGASCNVDGATVLHIFAGRPAAGRCQIKVEWPEQAGDATVLVDRIRPVTPDATELTTFRNCEVQVTPAGLEYLLDGVAPAYEGATHTFAADGDHTIVLREKGDEPAKDYVCMVSYPVVDVTSASQLAEIHICFLEAETAELADATKVSLEGPEYSATPVITALGDVEFKLAFEAPTVGGDYTLTVGEGAFTLDGNAASPMLIVFYEELSGTGAVAGIAADGTVVVCDLEGRVLMRGATAADLRTLRPGLYLIGGRKVVVK